MLRGAPMLEAVEAVADGLSEVAALISPNNCGDLVMARPQASDGTMKESSARTIGGKQQWHRMMFVLCVRSTFEFDIVCNVFNELEEFVPA